jgi:hypothetical protein
MKSMRVPALVQQDHAPPAERKPEKELKPSKARTHPQLAPAGHDMSVGFCFIIFCHPK